jgi:hypothetical protein
MRRPADTPGWRELLDRLDRERSAAFAVADPARLDAVYVPGSPALVRDRASVRRLRAAGLTAGGVRMRTSSVAVTHREGRRVELTVADSLSPYWLLRPDGSVAAVRPGRGAARWSVTLATVGRTWRILDVRRT